MSRELLAKSYKPDEVEQKWYTFWERKGFFKTDDALNVEYERERLQIEMARVTDDMDKLWKKINSEDFLSRAPEEVVMENRTRHSELIERFNKLESNLNHLPTQ